VLRQITQVEARIEALEHEQQQLEADLADPAVLADGERLAAAGIRHREVQEELAWQLREWEQLQEQAQAATA
jgi:protein subunit release factor A